MKRLLLCAALIVSGCAEIINTMPDLKVPAGGAKEVVAECKTRAALAERDLFPPMINVFDACMARYGLLNSWRRGELS